MIQGWLKAGVAPAGQVGRGTGEVHGGGAAGADWDILYRKLPKFTSTFLLNHTAFLPNSKIRAGMFYVQKSYIGTGVTGHSAPLKNITTFFNYPGFEGVEALEGCKNVA